MTVILLAAAFIVCFILKTLDESAAPVQMVFILAVFLVSRFTKGYLCGTMASLISVLGVNYIFTYPYFEVDFSAPGYP
ncbi:MAG: DUF4118 domain-containing protein, partial [Oscillospiraceae bacterium]